MITLHEAVRQCTKGVQEKLHLRNSPSLPAASDPLRVLVITIGAERTTIEGNLFMAQSLHTAGYSYLERLGARS